MDTAPGAAQRQLPQPAAPLSFEGLSPSAPDSTAPIGGLSGASASVVPQALSTAVPGTPSDEHCRTALSLLYPRGCVGWMHYRVLKLHHVSSGCGSH